MKMGEKPEVRNPEVTTRADDYKVEGWENEIDTSNVQGVDTNR